MSKQIGIAILLLSLVSFTLKEVAAQTMYDLAPLSWLPSNASVSHLLSNKEKIYIGTDIGLFKRENGQTDQIAVGTVSALAVSNEDVWVAIGDNIKNAITGQEFVLPRQTKMTSFTLGEGALWIGTETGLFKAILATGRIEEQTNRNSKFKKDKVNFVYYDMNKVLWVGTANGDYRIDDNKWKYYHKGQNVLDCYENAEGVWFVSANDMWLIDKFNREYPVGLDEDLAVGKLRDFCLDKKGTLYFASKNLVRYDPYNTKIEAFNDEITNLTNETTALLPYENAIIIGTQNKGLYSLGFLDSTYLLLNVVVDKLLTCESNSTAQLTAFVKGGQPPYVYLWDRNNEKTASIDGLKQGTVNVVVKDANGKSAQKSITINPPSKPKPVLDHITSSHKYLTDGAIYLRKIAGQNYTWSTGVEGETLKNVGSGTYMVTVKDAAGCTGTESFAVQEIQEESLINLDTLAIGEVVQVDNILFKADSIEVLESSLPVLNEILAFIQANPSVNIEIGGHTNTIPSHEYCDKLSTDRARNIAQFFYDRGVPINRVSYKGYGKRQPITNDQSLEGRRRNQRVEVKVLTK